MISHSHLAKKYPTKLATMVTTCFFGAACAPIDRPELGGWTLSDDRNVTTSGLSFGVGQWCFHQLTNSKWKFELSDIGFKFEDGVWAAPIQSELGATGLISAEFSHGVCTMKLEAPDGRLRAAYTEDFHWFSVGVVAASGLGLAGGRKTVDGQDSYRNAFANEVSLSFTAHMIIPREDLLTDASITFRAVQ